MWPADVIAFEARIRADARRLFPDDVSERCVYIGRWLETHARWMAESPPIERIFLDGNNTRH
jgi:hypothetical protein